ncbi:MAG: YcaO-like family protein [Kiritimatiellia bacterium]|jgi:ribosomal protein S12 methylthiotransferase accessory factor|nr:YcaO-like family protein [Kiritimatiellia bacterium]
MKLESRKKLAFGRCVPLEETVQRLEAVIGARYDYRLFETSVSDRLHWSALYIDDLEFRSMGKGITPLQARAGALAECAEWAGAKTHAELAGYTVGHQDVIPDAVGIEEMIPHVALSEKMIGRVKESDIAMFWADGFSLMTGRTAKLPIEFVRRIGGPSGMAAGNCREEAVVHAIEEVFERRVHITVLRQRLVMPTIDPDTVTHPVVREQLEFVRRQGIEVHLKDLSFGGALPCVGAYFWDPNIPEAYQFHHFFKVGAGFNLEEALVRVFTEYAQGRMRDEFIDGNPADQERVLKYDLRALKCIPDSGDNYLSAFMFGFVPQRTAEYLREGPVVPFRKGEAFDDCLQDINAAKEIFSRLGKECYVLDFTGPEIGFPVVEVVVPGYSDVLPYYPADSRVLFRQYTRGDILRSYDAAEGEPSAGGATHKGF